MHLIPTPPNSIKPPNYGQGCRRHMYRPAANLAKNVTVSEKVPAEGSHDQYRECDEPKDYTKIQDKPATSEPVLKLQDSDKCMKIINCWNNDTQKDNTPSLNLDLTDKVFQENKTLSDVNAYNEQKSAAEKVNNQVNYDEIEYFEGQKSGVTSIHFDIHDIITTKDMFKNEGTLSCNQNSSTKSELITNSKTHKKARVIESTNNQKESAVDNNLKAESFQKETDSGKSNVTSSCEPFSDEELKELEEEYIYEEDFISDISNDSSWSSIVQVADDTTHILSPRMEEQHTLLSSGDNKLLPDSKTSKEKLSHDIKCQFSENSIQDERIQTPPQSMYDTLVSKKSDSLLSERSKYIQY